jgi:hypothetical protein
VTSVRRLPPVAAVVLALALPAGAGAQKCIARPGTAALDQYCETVPTAVGDVSSRPADPRLRDVLSEEHKARVRRHGQDGEGLLGTPAGPLPPSSPGSVSIPVTAGAATDAPPDAPSSNPFSVAFDALGGVGTLGWFLVLVLALLAAVTAASAARAARASR